MLQNVSSNKEKSGTCLTFHVPATLPDPGKNSPEFPDSDSRQYMHILPGNAGIYLTRNKPVKPHKDT